MNFEKQTLENSSSVAAAWSCLPSILNVCLLFSSIDQYPRLPAGGGAEGLLESNRETGLTVGASSWIVPGDSLDYGFAIEGLLRKRDR